ncbi:hypothetical protein KKG08_01400, partial [Patescibacteria group bacterium]|nr:hypothetical protein [Patescibacteria group bacterium]
MGGYEQSIIDFPESESNSQSNVENIDTIRYNPENVSEGEEMEIKEKDVKPLLKVSRALKTSKLRGNI